MLRTLNDYLIEHNLFEGTIETWVDKAIMDRSKKEAIKWIEMQRDPFVRKNKKKIISMIEKLPSSLFASVEEPEDSIIEEEINWETVEEVYDDDEEEIDEDDWNDDVDEAVKRKRVVRGGKVQLKKKTDKPGYKVKGGKEVRMTPQEIMRRKRAAKKASLKRKSKKSVSSRKRVRSVAKRTW